MTANEKISSMGVCKELNISYRTLERWYKWYNSLSDVPKDVPKLPMYEQAKPRGAKFWTSEDVEQLKEFKKWIPKGRNGIMGRVSQRYWKPELRKDI